jgi:hypothetical protein
MRTKGKEGPSAWEGDWEGRVHQRIRQLGFTTYRDYLQARPGVSYDDLAAELSRDKALPPIAPVQLERMHAWTVNPDERKDAMLDSLVRYFRGTLRRGWGVGIHWEINAITALSFWSVNWGEGPELDSLEREIRQLNPEPGWVPQDSGDPIIQEAARRAWAAV